MPAATAARPRARLTPEVGAVAALTLLVAAFLFATLDVQSYWYAEADTVFVLEASFGDMLSKVPGMEGNPPLYYVLAWLWAKAFGTGEVGLRSLSALCGIALVPVAWAAARQLAGPRAGVAAAALVAVNPFLVWHAQDARPYMLVALLSGVALLFFARALDSERPREVALWALFSALAVLTHYFAAFVFAAEALWLLRRLRRRGVVVATGIVVACGLALIPIVLQQKDEATTSLFGSLATRVAQVPKQFLVGFDAPAERALGLVALLLAAAGIGLALTRGRPRARRAALMTLSVAVAGVGTPLLFALAGVDYLNARNVIAALLPAVIVVAAGLAAPEAGRWGLAALGALCAISLTAVVAVVVEPRFQRDNWRGGIAALGPATTARAIVVTPGQGFYPFRAYLPGARQVVGGEGAPVSEVEILALPSRTSTGTLPRPTPPLIAALNPPPGFMLVERRAEELFTLVRYRAPAPVRLSADQLVLSALPPNSPETLVFVEPGRPSP